MRQKQENASQALCLVFILRIDNYYTQHRSVKPQSSQKQSISVEWLLKVLLYDSDKHLIELRKHVHLNFADRKTNFK